jgi:hypothetical protein
MEPSRLVHHGCVRDDAVRSMRAPPRSRKVGSGTGPRPG